ncbi:MAG: DUF2851 family protein [Candidatus Marinimicrobia bacterium]|nr:DUF2851 family protein [Candidatus Neomarinimicrobiota bacterium]
MIPERELCSLWEEYSKSFPILSLKDGRRICIVSLGLKNKGKGPDYKSAIIMVGNKMLKGDIEIHINSGDWYLHRHDMNPNYEHVILHLVVNDEGIPIKNRKNKNVLTVQLPRELITENQQIGKCREKVIDYSKIKNYMKNLGLGRVKKKSIKFTEAINNRVPNQVLYEYILEAFGYSQNREGFYLLAKIVPINILYSNIAYFKNKYREIVIIESLLLGASGMLSKCTEINHEYTIVLRKIWNSARRNFNLKVVDFNNWDFTSIRPYNSPFIRILALSQIISKIYPKSFIDVLVANFCSKREVDEKIEWFFNLFQNPVYFWRNHPLLGGMGLRKLMGKSRVNDILINVILPYLLALVNINDKIDCRNNIFQLMENVKVGEIPNKILKMIKSLNIKKNDISSNLELQGLIDFNFLYCDKDLCRLCPLEDL